MNLANAPIAHEAFFATHFFTVRDLDKSTEKLIRENLLNTGNGESAASVEVGRDPPPGIAHSYSERFRVPTLRHDTLSRSLAGKVQHFCCRLVCVLEITMSRFLVSPLFPKDTGAVKTRS